MREIRSRQMPHDSSAKPSSVFGLTPELRHRLVRDYAATVLGSKGAGKAWMEGPHPLVRQGLVTIDVACRSPEGFQEAMAALRHISEIAQRTAR